MEGQNIDSVYTADASQAISEMGKLDSKYKSLIGTMGQVQGAMSSVSQLAANIVGLLNSIDDQKLAKLSKSMSSFTKSTLPNTPFEKAATSRTGMARNGTKDVQRKFLEQEPKIIAAQAMYIENLKKLNDSIMERIKSEKDIGAETKKAIYEKRNDIRQQEADNSRDYLNKVAIPNVAIARERNQYRLDKYFGYSGNAAGGVASLLNQWANRLAYSTGPIGIVARIGQRMGTNPDSKFAQKWGGRTMKRDSVGNIVYDAQGQIVYNDLDPKNINNRFNGFLKKATGGKGMNLGALGIFANPALLGAGAVAGLGLLTKAIIDLGEKAKVATGQIEMIKTQMSVVMGSDSVAGNIYSGIESFALKSPFGVQTSADMAVLLRQSGVAASDLLDTLRMIGDTSGGNAEKMRRVANNYAQIQAIGKASMLDMRQFAYAGIPIYKEVADYMKVSQVELRKMISEGKVSATVIEEVFKRMTGKGGVFENATMRGAATIQARMQNLEDLKVLEEANKGRFYMNWFGNREGTGLGNLVQSVKEGWHGFFKGLFGGLADDKELSNATSLLTSIRDYTASLDRKVKGDNGEYKTPDNNEAVLKILRIYMANNGGLDKFNARYAQRSQQNITGGKTIVSDEEYKELLKAREEIVKTKKEIDAYNRNQLEMVAPELASSTPSLAPKEYSDYLATANDVLSKVIPTSEFNKNKENEMNKNPEMYTQYVTGENELELQRITDLADRLSNNPEKLFMKSESYKTMYDNSPEGRQKAEELEKRQYAEYVKLYDMQKDYLSKNNDFLAENTGSLGNLAKALDTGLYRVSASYNLKEMTDSQLGNTAEEKLKHLNERMAFVNKLDSIALSDSGVLLAGRSEKEKREVKSSDFYSLLKKLYKEVAVGSMSSMAQAQITLDKLFTGVNQNKFSAFGSKQELIALFTSIFNDFRAADKAGNPFNSKADADKNYDPLWKRIMADSLGMDLSYLKNINTTAGIFDAFQQISARNNVEAGFASLVKNGSYYERGRRVETTGLTASDLAKILRYQADKDTVIKRSSTYGGTPDWQIDWNKTNKALEEFVLGLRHGTDAIRGLANAYENEANKYKTLSYKIFTGSETIPDILNGNLSEKMKNTFSGYIERGELSYRGPDKDVPELGEVEHKVKKMVDGHLYDEYNREIDYDKIKAPILKMIDELAQQANEDARKLKVQGIASEATEKWDSQTTSLATWLGGYDAHGNSINKQRWLNNVMSADSWDSQDVRNAYGWRQSRYAFGYTDTEGNNVESALPAGIAEKYTKMRDDIYKKYGFDSSDSLFTSSGEVNKSLGDDVQSAVDEWNEGCLKIQSSIIELKKEFTSLGDTIRSTFSSTVSSAWLGTMGQLGENVAKGVAGYEDMDKIIRNVGKSMMSNLASAATQAGLSLIAGGHWAAGMALIAAGGLGQFVSGLMSDTSSANDSDSEIQKLKDLKADLADLLKQAREDAIYYENHLRHSNSLSYNQAVSNRVTKVNDAVITPSGNVISTHPEDYLIASKNPENLAGGRAVPQVNIDFHNNTGMQMKVTQQKKQNASGGFDIIAMLEDAMGDYLLSSRSDDVFAARDARIKGRSTVA